MILRITGTYLLIASPGYERIRIRGVTLIRSYLIQNYFPSLLLPSSLSQKLVWVTLAQRG